MPETEAFRFVLDAEAQKQLAAMGVDLQQAFLDENRQFSGGLAPAGPGEKDVVAIITATAALAPLVVPIAKELIARLLPRSEVTIKETHDGERVVTEINTKQS